MEKKNLILKKIIIFELFLIILVYNFIFIIMVVDKIILGLFIISYEI
jgi:hypothetical protein